MIDLEQLKAIIREVVREELAAAKPAEPEHVTVASYAARHSMGVSTVRQAIREHRLPSIKIGRAVRIPAGAAIVSPDKKQARVLKAIGGGT